MKLKSTIIPIFGLLLLLILASFLPITLEKMKEGSSLKFKIRNAGLNVEGKFEDVMLSFNWNEKDISLSDIYAEIAVNSIKTGIELRDEHLQGADYFNSDKHPLITFRSSEIKFLTENKYVVEGKLIIKGQSKIISVPVERKKMESGIYFKGNIKLNRLDFGVGKSSWIMSDDVFVEIELRQ